MFSRRTWLATGVALLAALPLTSVLAAPFASDRITVRTEGAGPDVVLIPGLNSSPRAWASTVAALPGYRYHLVQISGFAGQPVGGNEEGTVAAPAKVEAVADGIAAGMRAATPEQRSKRASETIAGMVDTEAMRPGAIEDSMSSDPDVGIRAYRELIVTNLIPELPKISVPVTVLYVQPKSVPLPAEQFDGVYKSAYAPIENLTLKRIADSAHFIMWDQPQRFQAEVNAFLPAR
jgi:pimeloyl-ACP methyl ester carboxylesterase